MKFTILINQVKANEWALNLPQAVLFAFCYELPSWAEKVIIGNEIYYFSSKNKIVAELPLLSDKPDTVYRLLKQLEEKKLIVIKKQGKKDFIKLNSICKEWNSEKNPNSEIFPTLPGKISEQTPEKNPTNKNTILDQNTIDEHIRKRKIDFIQLLLAWVNSNPEKYPKLMIFDFTKYWLEPTLEKKKTVLRFEGQAYFEFGRRLSTWFNRVESIKISQYWEKDSKIDPLNVILKTLFNK